MEKEKKSPLALLNRKRVQFDDDRSKFRAITEEVDGQNVRRLRGYPILFNVPGKPRRQSPWVEIVNQNALVGVDLSKLVMLFDHNTTWVLGRVGKNMRAEVDATGLFVEVTLGNTWIDDYVFDRVSREIVDGMSFWFDSKAVIATNWETKTDIIMQINEIYEVSVLVFPAYEDTIVVAQDEPAPDPVPDDAAEIEAKKMALISLISQL